MARSFIPDPLELLRQAVNRLDGRAQAGGGRGLEIEQVMRTLQQLSSASTAVRQGLELALENVHRRLNLPTGEEFAEMAATLARVEHKLDRLLAAEARRAGAAAPTRARKPAADAAQPAAKPRKTAAAKRPRAAKS